ncbi:MAG: sulfotransferase [Alphaproteobacteria bacterium]|nr:sulfotransferase [Alphaproteobacteria bacterium]
MLPETLPFGLAERPIFIGGMMKSGTSLLRVLLGQHPDLYGTFESHWFEDALRLGWSDAGSRRVTFLREFLEIDDTSYDAMVAAKRAEPAREFIDIVYEAMLKRENKRRWLDKTPDNVLHFDEIRRVWPQATLIHVTREPRDCLASWKDKRGDDLLAFLAAAQRVWDALGDRLGRGSGSGYLEIDYSDLVGSTGTAMAALLSGLDEPWHADVAEIDLCATHRERETVKRVTGRDSHTNRSLARPIFTDSVGQWRSILSDEEAATITAELAPLYERLGERWAASC